MKTIIYTKEMQWNKECQKFQKMFKPEPDKGILDMLAKKYNCNIEDIEIDDAYFVYVYYLNDKQIYVDQKGEIKMNELIIVCPNCGCEMSISGTCPDCGTKDYTESEVK